MFIFSLVDLLNDNWVSLYSAHTMQKHIIRMIRMLQLDFRRVQY